MQESQKKAMAMFRYGLIAPVINKTYRQPTKRAYFRDVVSEPLELPDGSKTSYAVSTLAYWEMIYRKGGFDALNTKGRSDKGYPRKLSSEAMERTIALKNEFPRINATMIRDRLIAEKTICAKEVSLSTIQRFVRKNKEIVSAKTDGIDRKAFEAERICEIWQADTMYGPRVCYKNGKTKAYLISIIDDKSRLIISSRFYLADNALNFQRTFKDGVLRFGIPEKLYVDNGGSYKNDQLFGICGRIGCVLIHAPVRDGQAKGKIERWHRTVRDQYLSVLDDKATDSIDALNADFISWLTKYNTTEHSATKMTPMDCYARGADCVRTARSKEWLDEMFLNTINRTVKNDSTISFDNQLYDVPMQFIGQRITVRYLPGDSTSLHVFEDEIQYPCQITNKVDNAKTARATARYKIPYNQTGDDTDGNTHCSLPAQS